MMKRPVCRSHSETAGDARYLVVMRKGDIATGVICDEMQHFAFWDNEDIEPVPLQALADQWLRNRKRHEEFMNAIET